MTYKYAETIASTSGVLGEILRAYVYEGKTGQQIAKERHRSLKTIETTLQRVTEKFHVSAREMRAELARYGAAAALGPQVLDNSPISEEWLKSVGFRWHQLDRQPDKHWLLWLGAAIPDRITSFEDLGLELGPRWWKNRHGDDVGDVGSWHAWLRADTSGRYHRFIHIRALRTQGDVTSLVASMIGRPWDPATHYAGMVYQPKHIAAIRKDLGRLDHQIREGNHKWSEVEKDDSRGRALPEHLEAHAKAAAQAERNDQ